MVEPGLDEIGEEFRVELGHPAVVGIHDEVGALAARAHEVLLVVAVRGSYYAAN